MSAVKQKIQKLLKEEKISVTEANRMLESAGEVPPPVAKKVKRSLFHVIWLGLLFVILSVVYTHVFKGHEDIDVKKSLEELSMWSDKNAPAQSGIEFPGVSAVVVTQPQSKEFKESLLNKMQAYRVELSEYLRSGFTRGPLQLSKFMLMLDFDKKGNTRNFKVKDAGGRKLKIDSSLYGSILNWKFQGYQIQNDFSASVPVVLH